MRRSIRVVGSESEKRPTLRQILEERARRIVWDAKALWTPTESSSVEREIALTLDHLDHARALDERMHRELRDLELYVDTKLMQLWPGKTDQVPYLLREADRFKLAERDRLQEKLLWIEQDRRRLAVVHEERSRPLHDRLLLLWNRHVYLSLEWTSRSSLRN